jgi:DNA cross-link repair 1A protein
MSGHKEKEQWKDAEIDLKRDGKRHFGRRKAPFYKVLTGMPVAVDAFRYGAIPKVKAYLLTSVRPSGGVRRRADRQTRAL